MPILVIMGMVILWCFGILFHVIKWACIVVALAYCIVMFTPEENLKTINEHIMKAKDYVLGEEE